MDIYIYGIILIITYLPYFAVEGTLTQYYFHENCERTLVPFKVAGELIFSSRDVHSVGHRTRHCEVTISPKEVNSNNNNNNRIMFYFTEFNIGRRCSNNNLTVIDGRHQHVHIKGIPDVLCGHNTSLENNSTVFTSKQSDTRLRYQWSEYGGTFSGSFKLVFISFYDGPCVSEAGVYGCDNNRCISTDISCQSGINPCGDGKHQDCDTPSESEDVISQFIESIPTLGFIVAVCIGLFLLKKFVYDKLVWKYGSIKNVPVIKLLFRPRIFHHTNPHPEIRRRSSITEPDFRSAFDDQTSLSSIEVDSISSISIDNRIARIETTRNRNETVHNRNDTIRNRNETTDNSNEIEENRNETISTNNTELPTYDAFINDTQRYPPTAPDSSNSATETTAPPITSDVAPPPSYEDVMADNDRYVMR